MDIFCSTSHRSSALQKSSNEILPWPHWSASIIVRSAMLNSWSWLMFAPTIICRMFRSSSRDIDSSSSKSYILNATETFLETSILVDLNWKVSFYKKINSKYSHFNFSSRLFSLFTVLFLIGRKCARTCINCRKFTRSSALSAKNAWTIRSHSGFIASSGIRRKSSRDNVPQSVRSKDVKREYNRSIWFGVTKKYSTKHCFRQNKSIRFYGCLNELGARTHCFYLYEIRMEWIIKF